jgi:hypothetical protein
LRVSPKALHQGQRWRNEPVLAKFGFTHSQDPAVKVNVGYPQVQHLANPQAAAIQEPKYFRHDEMAQRRFCGWFELVDGVEQSLNLGVCQDAR